MICYSYDELKQQKKDAKAAKKAKKAEKSEKSDKKKKREVRMDKEPSLKQSYRFYVANNTSRARSTRALQLVASLLACHLRLHLRRMRLTRKKVGRGEERG